MKLATSTEWLGSIPESPPLYNFDKIVPPPDIELRFIGIRHHTDSGLPDYVDEVLSETDAFIPELPGWNAQTPKQLSRMTRGDYDALTRFIDAANWLKQSDPGAYEYSTFLMRAAYRAQKPILLVDYPDGDKFNRVNRAMDRPNVDAMWPVHKAREQFILEGLATTVKTFRETARRTPRSPLRIAMLYGAAHMAISEGVSIAASQHGIDLSVTREFEDSLVSLQSAADNPVAIPILIDYQTKLRMDEKL
jgi:hypothetical protein